MKYTFLNMYADVMRIRMRMRCNGGLHSYYFGR